MVKIKRKTLTWPQTIRKFIHCRSPQRTEGSQGACKLRLRRLTACLPASIIRTVFSSCRGDRGNRLLAGSLRGRPQPKRWQHPSPCHSIQIICDPALLLVKASPNCTPHDLQVRLPASSFRLQIKINCPKLKGNFYFWPSFIVRLVGLLRNSNAVAGGSYTAMTCQTTSWLPFSNQAAALVYVSACLSFGWHSFVVRWA